MPLAFGGGWLAELSRLFKIFGFGVFLGLALSGVAAWFLPVADLHREASIISVQPNGGNAELYRIHIPEDRILAGNGESAELAPESLEWPVVLQAEGIGLELFKLRNRDDAVIGIASRLAVRGSATQPGIEWMLHLPARGTMYFPLAARSNADGVRSGPLRAGTREFERRSGSIRERFVTAGSDDAGTIELTAALVSTLPDDVQVAQP